MKVKGIESVKSRSERARLKIRTFLAVLLSLRQMAAAITLRFPGTKINTKSRYFEFLYFCKDLVRILF